MSNRDNSLDFMRGFAILMMIVFHLIYDLNEFGFTHIPLYDHWLAVGWRYLIVFLFLSSVGISLVLAYNKQLNITKFCKRIIIIGLASLSVSVGTYFMFPDAWVYFGILHLILLCSLIAIFFVNLPNISLLISIIILVLNYFNLPDLSFLNTILAQKLPKNSIDFYPLFPWLSIVFIGIYMAHNPWYKKIFIFRSTFVQALGRNALIIYLVHQVALFGIVATIHHLINL